MIKKRESCRTNKTSYTLQRAGQTDPEPEPRFSLLFAALAVNLFANGFVFVLRLDLDLRGGFKSLLRNEL